MYQFFRACANRHRHHTDVPSFPSPCPHVPPVSCVHLEHKGNQAPNAYIDMVPRSRNGGSRERVSTSLNPAAFRRSVLLLALATAAGTSSALQPPRSKLHHGHHRCRRGKASAAWASAPAAVRARQHWGRNGVARATRAPPDASRHRKKVCVCAVHYRHNKRLVFNARVPRSAVLFRASVFRGQLVDPGSTWFTRDHQFPRGLCVG